MGWSVTIDWGLWNSTFEIFLKGLRVVKFKDIPQMIKCIILNSKIYDSFKKRYLQLFKFGRWSTNPYPGNAAQLVCFFIRPNLRGSGMGRILCDLQLNKSANCGRYSKMFACASSPISKHLVMNRNAQLLEKIKHPNLDLYPILWDKEKNWI